jgi:hypothetical protein
MKNNQQQHPQKEHPRMDFCRQRWLYLCRYLYLVVPSICAASASLLIIQMQRKREKWKGEGESEAPTFSSLSCVCALAAVTLQSVYNEEIFSFLIDCVFLEFFGFSFLYVLFFSPSAFGRCALFVVLGLLRVCVCVCVVLVLTCRM